METKGKFTYVDFIIIILVIAVLAFGWLYLTRSANTETTQIEYTVNIQNIHKEVADKIKVGDKIFDSTKNFLIGEITDAEIKPYISQSFDTLEGKFINAPVPERYEATITLRSEGSYGEKITVGEFEIFTGKSIFIKSADFVASGVVYEIKEVKNNG